MKQRTLKENIKKIISFHLGMVGAGDEFKENVALDIIKLFGGKRDETEKDS